MSAQLPRGDCRVLDRDYLLAQQSNIGELKLLSRMPEFINFSALSDEYAEDCVHYTRRRAQA